MLVSHGDSVAERKDFLKLIFKVIKRTTSRRLLYTIHIVVHVQMLTLVQMISPQVSVHLILTIVSCLMGGKETMMNVTGRRSSVP